MSHLKRYSPMGGELKNEDAAAFDEPSRPFYESDELSRHVEYLLSLEDEEEFPNSPSQISERASFPNISHLQEESIFQDSEHSSFRQCAASSSPHEELYSSVSEEIPDGKQSVPPFIFKYRQHIDVKLPFRKIGTDQYVQPTGVDYETVSNKLCISTYSPSLLPCTQEPKTLNEYKSTFKEKTLPLDTSVRPKDKVHFKKSTKAKNSSLSKKTSVVSWGKTELCHLNLDNVPVSNLPENIPLNPRIRWYPYQSFVPTEDICEAGTQTSSEMFESKNFSLSHYRPITDFMKDNCLVADDSSLKASSITPMVGIHEQGSYKDINVTGHQEPKSSAVFQDNVEGEISSADVVLETAGKIDTYSEQTTQTPPHSTYCYYHKCRTKLYTALCDALKNIEEKGQDESFPSDTYSRYPGRIHKQSMKVISPSAKLKTVVKGDKREDFSKILPVGLRKTIGVQTSFPRIDCDCVYKVKDHLLKSMKRRLKKMQQKFHKIKELQEVDYSKRHNAAFSEDDSLDLQDLPLCYGRMSLPKEQLKISPERHHLKRSERQLKKSPRLKMKTYENRNFCRRIEHERETAAPEELRSIYRERAQRYSQTLARYAAVGIVNHPRHKRILKD